MKRVENRSDKKNIEPNSLFLIMMLVFVAASIFVLFFVYRAYMGRFRSVTTYDTYDEYYVMISNNRKSSLIQNVYEQARKVGLDKGVYVDLLGDNLSSDYNEADLMKIAIASEVNGIIIDADESEEMTKLINQATELGIPVVTLINDNTQSERCSYIGIGGYEIGREYGAQISKIVEERMEVEEQSEEENVHALMPIEVAVLVNSNDNSTSQNVIISGITETLESNREVLSTPVNLRIIAVNNSNAFSVEESVRDIFVDGDLPAIIVCLDELTTTCVYQAVVDYNIVGNVDILGYYDSDTIINAINRNVIYSTIAIDSEKLGNYCVNALKDYNELGATSQYYTGDITLIDKSNVAQYLKEGNKNE